MMKIEVTEYAERRQKFFDKMANNSVAVFYAGLSKKASADHDYPFVINKNFFYFTGIEQENSSLMLVKVNQEVYTYLFIDQFDELKEKWTGKRLMVEEASAISGIKNVFFSQHLEAKLHSVLREDDNQYGKINTLYLDLEEDLKIGANVTTQTYKEELLKKYKVTVENSYPLVVRMRMIKSPREVEMLKQAIYLTNHGLKAIIQTLKPNMYEYQVGALFAYVIADKANASLAFPTIVASGKNATILHYPTLSEKIKDAQLLLLDLGAAYGQYNGDISRTYPVNGVFNSLQKSLYEIVLACNKAVIQFAGPGKTLLDLQAFATNFMAAKLIGEGYIKTAEEIGKVYYHNVSHHLGLDTHDPADRSLPLEPGNVITVEPGLYFKELGIGIRVEDDVLITVDGCENLSKVIIKEVADIEKAFKQA